VDLTIVATIVQLIFLEGILSIDNAAVLGAMVLHLPEDQTIIWPRQLEWLGRWLSESLGSQRDGALKVGLLGAYAGRALMLLSASVVIHLVWVRIAGALYLLYLTVGHLGKFYHTGGDTDAGGPSVRRIAGGFWATVGATVLADLAFSIDNVIAAVALSNELWVVFLGVAIGMLIMRFAATLFSRAISWEPTLETGAYLLLLAIGGELLASELFGLTIAKPVQFAISVGILALTVLFARTPLRGLLVIFRPIIAVFAAVDWALEGTKSALLAPLRRLSSGERGS
jgi:tellurite resistance protein TerC